MERQQLLAGTSSGTFGFVEANLQRSPIQQRSWWHSLAYEQSRRFLRVFLYFASRYFIRGRFRDGLPDLVCHFLKLSFRFYVDPCYFELLHKLPPASIFLLTRSNSGRRIMHED